jgi:hypothetical protein
MGGHLWPLQDYGSDDCQNEASPKGDSKRYYEHFGGQDYQHKDKYEMQELMHYGFSASLSTPTTSKVTRGYLFS